jgi:N-sulfoglucosamine sulfohydrolase
VNSQGPTNNIIMSLIPRHLSLLAATLLAAATPANAEEPTTRPNILFVISDDQSWAHTGAAGYKAARTPAFDRIAAEGVLFEQAFAPTPGCSPTRAAILTGRNNWQIEQAGTHASSFPTYYEVFPLRLQSAGYFIGKHGKGWAPGDTTGWPHDPAGPNFPGENYTDAFRGFLDARTEGQPFCFWLGASEPHPSVMRAERGIGLKSGFNLDEIEVPPFLPDVADVRSHIADYLALIERYDTHLGRMLDLLDEIGELDNTLIIVTSDHGMGFPRAKANLYEYSTRVPLAVRWGNHIPTGRRVADLVNLIDLTATIYEATGVEPPQTHPIAGRSLLEILWSDGHGIVDATRDAVFCGRERHTSARHDNLGYPMRSIRTHEFLYIRNFAPKRWPAGAPRSLNPQGELRPFEDFGSSFADIDPGVSKVFMFENRHHEAHRKFFQWSVAKRPAEELFDIRSDSGCLINLAGEPRYAEARAKLAARLDAHLRKTGDPRLVGPDPAIFESYPRLIGGIRNYPAPEDEPDDWKEFENP